MKKLYLFICIVSSFNCACKPEKNVVSEIVDKRYQSLSEHLSGRKEMTINSNNTFAFIGYGPSIFISRGSWNYSNNYGKIILNSYKAEQKYLNNISVDTTWSNFSNSVIKILSKEKILFENTYYYLTPNKK